MPPLAGDHVRGEEWIAREAMAEGAPNLPEGEPMAREGRAKRRIDRVAPKLDATKWRIIKG